MTHRILIVDDEPDILSALEVHCSILGYETVTTDDPYEAIEKIQIEKFHITLLDINMPKVNGIDLLRNVKSIKPTTQVIMITAFTTLEKAIDCWESGATDYILKPFADLDQIGDIIEFTSQRIQRWENIARQSIRA